MKKERTLEEKTILLKNQSMYLGISEQNGAITRLAFRPTGWELIRDPKLGLSFRMLVPTPSRRNTQVLGEHQVPPRILEGERELTLYWGKLVSEDGEALPIEVTAHIRMEEQ